MPDAPAPESSAPDMSGLEAAQNDYVAEQSGAAPAAPAPAVQEAPAKAEPAAPAADTKPKKPWEMKVESQEQEKPAEAPPAEDETPPAGLKPEAQIRWGDLRKIETEYKALKPEVERLRAENAELKAAPPRMPEETEAELKELRQFRAAYEVEKTPEYQEAVSKPYAKHTARLNEVAEYAKVSFDALYEATQQPNGRIRARMIRDVLSKSAEEINETDIQEAVSAINDLMPVFDEAARLKSESEEIRNAMTGREKQQAEAKEAARAQSLTKASGEIFSTLHASFKDIGLLDDPALAKAVREAKPADVDADPMMAAYSAQASVLLPALVDKWNEDRRELFQLRKTVAARGKASPSTTGTTAPAGSKTVTEEEHFNELENLARQYTQGLAA